LVNLMNWRRSDAAQGATDGHETLYPVVPSMNRFVRRRARLRQIVLGVGCAIFCARLGSTGAAWAEESGAFRFTWSAPEECPSQEQVEAEITRLVRGDLRLHDGSDLQAEVTVSRGALWSAELTTQRAGRLGRRSLEAPSCAAAAHAVALIIALSIDPDAAASGADAPAAATAPASQVPSSSALQILAGFHTQGRIGALPGTDIGVGLGIGLAGPRWHSELRWTYGLRRDQSAALPSGEGGRFNLAAGSLTGCFDVGRTKLAFGPCAVAEAGRVAATGYGATAGFSKNTTWLAVGGGIFASLVLSKHLHLLFEVDALAPLHRPAYVFDDIPGVVFRAPAVGGRALVELSWQF
jgi:hypothetical protein